MSLIPGPVTHSPLRRTWNIASDLLIAIAVIWTLPLLLGILNALTGR